LDGRCTKVRRAFVGRKKIWRKLKKTYAKMLSAYAKKKLAKAYELEDRAIRLELELRDKAEKNDSI